VETPMPPGMLSLLPSLGLANVARSDLADNQQQLTNAIDKALLSATTSSRTSDSSSSIESPATDDASSDIVVQLRPLSELASPPQFAFIPRKIEKKTVVAAKPASPGTLKKRLFLQRLDRRGVSHDDGDAIPPPMTGGASRSHRADTLGTAGI